MSSDKLDKKVKNSKDVSSVIDSDINSDADSKNNSNDVKGNNTHRIDANNHDKLVDNGTQVAVGNQLVDSGIQLTGGNGSLDESSTKSEGLLVNMKLSNPIKDKSFGSIVDFASIGLLFVSSIFVGATMGYFLDIKFGTKPYLSLIFLILGLISGVKSVYKILKKTGMMNGQK